MDLEVLRAGPEPATTDRPPLVLVHGGYHAAWCWERFLPFLGGLGYPCRAVSLRGHGGSAGRERLDKTGLADYETDVESVLADLPTRPVLVGHSMGASVVQRLLARDPSRLRGVVLLASPPPTGFGPGIGVRWLRTGMRPVLQLAKLHQGKLKPGAAASRDTFPYGCFFAGDLSIEELRPYGERMQPESKRVGRELNRRVARVPAQLPPVLALAGERDWFFPPDVARRTAAAYGTQLVLVPGMGHDVMLDAGWKDAARAVARFLEAL